MHLEVIENNDVAGRQRWGELRFDIDIERRAIHCPGNDPYVGGYVRPSVLISHRRNRSGLLNDH